jgi:outer membrane protein FlgP
MKKMLWLIPLAGLLAGCASYSGRDSAYSASAANMPAKVVKLSAIGFGNMGTFEGYTPGQKRLMAMRASKLDAYRALAEQVHGVRVTGNSTVAAMVSQNDSFRVFVDAYVRGAKVASVTPMAEGNYETVLELELGGDFFENLRNRVAFQSEQPHGATNLASRSAVGPGGSYSSNFYYSE